MTRVRFCNHLRSVEADDADRGGLHAGACQLPDDARHGLGLGRVAGRVAAVLLAMPAAPIVSLVSLVGSATRLVKACAQTEPVHATCLRDYGKGNALVIMYDLTEAESALDVDEGERRQPGHHGRALLLAAPVQQAAAVVQLVGDARQGRVAAVLVLQQHRHMAARPQPLEQRPTQAGRRAHCLVAAGMSCGDRQSCSRGLCKFLSGRGGSGCARLLCDQLPRVKCSAEHKRISETDRLVIRHLTSRPSIYW